MSARVDSSLGKDIAKFGGPNVSSCFNCGNCTAVCTLSRDTTAFPRRSIRLLQLGLREPFESSPDPWLCYYCGDCSTTCPRNAQPGELMMAARRYLTSRYDWTGLSRKLYISKAWEIATLIFLAMIVVALFVLSGSFTPERMNLEHVSVNTFAPVEWVHYGDWVMAGLLLFFLGTNAWRMHRLVMSNGGGASPPLSAYLTELREFFSHAATQKEWRKCDTASRGRWLKHMFLVIGYVTMFLLVVVFLPWFQRDGAEFHFTSLFGYYATAFLLYYTVEAMIGRWKKRESLHKSSHYTDWMFLILLFLTTLSGMILHLCRMLDLPLATYVVYVAHLAIAVPMLLIEVPFGKWAHLLYRPLAIYLERVRVRATEPVMGPAVPVTTN